MALLNPWLNTNQTPPNGFAPYPTTPTTPQQSVTPPKTASGPYNPVSTSTPAPAPAPVTAAPAPAPVSTSAPAPTSPAPYPTAPTAAPTSGGDPYIAEVRASGKSKSEDYAQVSDAELQAWKQYYVGNGKYRNIYGDIVDKPDERGPNTPHNRNGTGDQGDYGWGWNDSGTGGTPNQGSGGASGSGSGGASGSPADISSRSDTLWNEIMNLQSRYSPEIMQRLMAGAKRQGSAAGASARTSSDLDAVRRGMGRSGVAAQLSGEAARTAEANVVNPASSFYAAEKVKADQEDRITKLNAMQNWFNSSRQHIQAMTATQNQKEIALANLDLAEQRLKQELAMQQNQFDFNFAYDARNQVRY